MNLWSQATQSGPGGSRWIRGFIYYMLHKCKPRINCSMESFLCKPENCFKRSWIPTVEMPVFWVSLLIISSQISSIAQNNHSGNKNKQLRKKQRYFSFVRICSSPAVRWEIFMPRGSWSSLCQCCWISLGVQSKPRASKLPCAYCRSGRNLCAAPAAGWTEQGMWEPPRVVQLTRPVFLRSVSKMQQLGAFSVIQLISTADISTRTWDGNSDSLGLM